ncbi:hypothetical protein ISCGN_017053 [Ixodes scapularis]
MAPSVRRLTGKVVKTSGERGRKRRRRRRCSKKTTEAVGFLNLHGARREQKWEELYRELEGEDMTLFGVAETHLRDLEEPPTSESWYWAGRNRLEGTRRGGGVGVVSRSSSVWHKEPGECWDHIWHGTVKPGEACDGVTVCPRSYSGELTQVEGRVDVSVQFHDKKAVLPLFVTGDKSPTLLGRNWIRELGLNFSHMEELVTTLKGLTSCVLVFKLVPRGGPLGHAREDERLSLNPLLVQKGVALGVTIVNVDRLLGGGVCRTTPEVEGDPDGTRRSSEDVCVPVDTIGRAGPLCTASAYEPREANKTRFFASWYGMFSWTFNDTRLREAEAEVVYCLARGAPKGPNIPRAQLNHQGPLFPGHGYATHSQTWVGEPTWLGVRSDATHQAPTKVGAPCVRVWWPTWLGSVVTLLTKHLAPKVQAPPAGLGHLFLNRGNIVNLDKLATDQYNVCRVRGIQRLEFALGKAFAKLYGNSILGGWCAPF